MQEKLRLLAANKNVISVAVILLFIGSVIYFLYALGFIRPGQGDPLVESATTSLPVTGDTATLSDPSEGSKTALELNSALKKQQQQSQSTSQQTIPPKPTKAATATPKATATSAPSATSTPSPTPTITPTQSPTSAPTTTPTTVPTQAPTNIPSPTEVPTVTP